MEDDLPPNWKTLATANLKLKVFVKAKNENKIPEKKKRKGTKALSFTGDEAKEIYESIIQEDFENDFASDGGQQVTQQQLEATTSDFSSDFVVKTEGNSRFGERWRHKAMKHAQHNEVEPLTEMLRSGLCVDSIDDHGWSLLMVAACAGSLEVVQTLLKHKARTDIQDANGNTAVFLAGVKGHSKVVSLISRASEADSEVYCESDDERASTSVNFTEFFCDVCQRTFRECTRIQHETSITHQFNIGSAASKTIYGISPSNKGYQLLVNQGWNAEKGLGPESSGAKYPVKTVLKRNRKGLGASTKETARVTHFGPGDESAVKRPESSDRVMRSGTLSRREKRMQKIKEDTKERDIRRMLNEPDL